MNLWRRLVGSYRKSERRRDEIAVDKALLVQDQAERRNAREPGPMPPISRGNTIVPPP